jgi:uncharacterized protein (TIGR02145 family)
MKRLIGSIIILSLTILFVSAQDTLYIYKAGIVIKKHAVNDIDSVTFSKLYLKPVVGTFTDIEGNIYKWIKIGNQTWMAENLKSTKFRNGESISNVTDAALWTNATFAASCNYNNDASNGLKYGKLYNWYSVNDSRNICPVGWHVPTEAEWAILTNYLIVNGYNYDGTTSDNKLGKALASKTDWIESTYVGAVGNDITKNNSSGFNGLPSGVRNADGTFSDIGNSCVWWTTSIGSSSTNAWFRYILSSGAYTNSYPDGNMKRGYSVRCIKDL